MSVFSAQYTNYKYRKTLVRILYQQLTSLNKDQPKLSF